MPPQRTNAADEWLTPAGFALLLGLLVLIAFPQVLLGLETFVARDFGVFAYPAAYFQRECFWRGELPFWNPYSNCGLPFLAQWNTMPLYPPTLLYLVLPLTWALGFFCLLHLWFGGLGMYTLARRWTGNRLAASLAGVVFAFNGLSQNSLMWPSHTATLSWMPWVILFVESAWREGGRKLACGALCGAMQLLAGGPETILFTWVLLLFLCGIECWRPGSQELFPRALHHGPGRARVRIASRFVVVAAVATAVAAIQLLPFLDLATHSQRDQRFSDLRWSMPGRGWANFLVPTVFGRTGEAGLFFQQDQGWTSSYYVGVATIALALLAARLSRERRVVLLLAACAAAFVCALGDQTILYSWLLRLAPVFKVMAFPVKFLIVAAFAAPLLAAFAAARLWDPPREQTQNPHRLLLWLSGALLIGIAAILVWEASFPSPLDDVPAAWRNGLARAAFLAAIVAAFLLLRRATRARSRKLFALMLLLVTWLDLRTHAPNQTPTVSPAVYSPGMVRAELGLNPQPSLGASRVMVSPEADEKFDHTPVPDVRTGYLARRLGYFSNCNLLDEVPKVNGFFSLYPAQCYQVSLLLYLSTNAHYPQLMDFLGVSHVTAPGECTVWQARPSFRPLATAGQTPVFLDDPNIVAGLIRSNFDSAATVFLPPEAQSLVTVTNQTDARVVGNYAREKIELETQASEPSLVVIAQSYYHRWRAYVDGRPSPLLRANYAFQAVQVPAGSHQVRVVYEDPWFTVGALISAAALAGCTASLLRFRRRNPGAATASG